MSDLSAGFSEPPRRKRAAKHKWVAIVGVPLLAILFQVYVPRFFTYLAYLELPLLVTVYFSLRRRSPPFGVLFGMCIGLTQDALWPGASHPLGMFGIVKTLVGYFAASVSQRFESASALLRLVLAFFFFFFHQFFYWVLARALLGEAVSFEPLQTLVLAVLNAAVAVPLFRILDKLDVTE